MSIAEVTSQCVKYVISASDESLQKKKMLQFTNDFMSGLKIVVDESKETIWKVLNREIV